MPLKRHKRHDRVLLEEVCRTTDNTSVPVLKMLVVSTEGHAQMPYIKRQTRVSMVPEKNVSSRRSRHAFVRVQKKGLRLMNGDEYLDRRETILHL